MTATFSLHSMPSTSLNTPPRKPPPTAAAAAAAQLPIRCGPRDKRGPLVKGRTLSTEAIQAVQSLKRAHRADPAAPAAATALPSHLRRSLTRLLKSDLLAALRELLRQDRCALALQVLAVVRSEYGPVELALYADVASALARQGMGEEIDALVGGAGAGRPRRLGRRQGGAEADEGGDRGGEEGICGQDVRADEGERRVGTGGEGGGSRGQGFEPGAAEDGGGGVGRRDRRGVRPRRRRPSRRWSQSRREGGVEGLALSYCFVKR
ncbi:hypothetical protein NL676_006774 [Syzygium grande]|nr:hypothetical protein NL676_006774 [Syzygium grande]